MRRAVYRKPITKNNSGVQAKNDGDSTDQTEITPNIEINEPKPTVTQTTITQVTITPGTITPGIATEVPQIGEDTTPVVSEDLLAIQQELSSNPHPKFHELPEKYRSIQFNYRFRHNGHAGTPHPMKHQKLELKSYERQLKGELPLSYSLEKYVTQNLVQGNIGACVAHSGVQAIHILMCKRDEGRWMLSKLLTYPKKFYGSRLFLYDNARRVDGTPLNEDAGCTNLSACIAMDKYKICPEPVWPYEEKNMYVQPSHDAFVAAANYKNFSYSVLESIDDIKHAIRSGYPVMIGVVVCPSFINAGMNGNSGDIPIPHTEETPIGGHSILLVAYDDNTKRFKFNNWWGAEWGSNSYGTIPYDFVANAGIAGDFVAVQRFE